MKKTIIFNIFLVLALILTACSSNSTDTSINNPAITAETLVNNGNEESAASSTERIVEQGAVTETVTPFDFATFFPVDYENALSSRNQLMIGTLKLAESPYPINAEQAKTLLPLWQAILALESNPASALQEMTAVQNLIVASMTREQLDAVLAMKLTNEDLTAVYAELGIAIAENTDGTTMGSGQGTGSGKDPAVRDATRTAAAALGTPVGEGGGQGQINKNALIEKVIDYLASITAN